MRKMQREQNLSRRMGLRKEGENVHSPVRGNRKWNSFQVLELSEQIYTGVSGELFDALQVLQGFPQCSDAKYKGCFN